MTDNHEEKFKYDGGIKMDQLENANVVKKANVYYNGNVTSRTVLLADGTRKNVGHYSARPI